TVSLSGGHPNAGLSGTTTAAAAAGVATFSHLSVNKSGRNYSLAAHARGGGGGASTAVNISNGNAHHLAITGVGASATSSVDVTFSVEAFDDQDNPASDWVGTVHVTSDDAAAVLPANKTAASGVASDLKIKFKTTGVHTLT